MTPIRIPNQRAVIDRRAHIEAFGLIKRDRVVAEPDHARATAAGLMTMMGFLGAGIATVALPVIATRTGLASGFGMMAGLYVVAVLALLFGRSQLGRMHAEQTHD